MVRRTKAERKEEKEDMWDQGFPDSVAPQRAPPTVVIGLQSAFSLVNKLMLKCYFPRKPKGTAFRVNYRADECPPLHTLGCDTVGQPNARSILFRAMLISVQIKSYFHFNCRPPKSHVNIVTP
jgi:hypothetical protein